MFFMLCPLLLSRLSDFAQAEEKKTVGKEGDEEKKPEETKQVESEVGKEMDATNEEKKEAE